MTIYRVDKAPNVAAAGDRWVDTSKGKEIWLIPEAYDLSGDYASLEIPATARPAIALDFHSLLAGVDGECIKVSIQDQGETGTSTLTKSGNGEANDPYIYEFKTYQNDNSNSSIISLLAGDLALSASGADATAGSCSNITESALSVGLSSLLCSFNINFAYKAQPAKMVSVDDGIPAEIPANVMDVLGDALAARMAEMKDGNANAQSIQTWQNRFGNAVLKARKNKRGNIYPNRVRLG